MRVEGPKGKLERTLNPAVTVAVDSGKKEVVITRADDSKNSKAQHGTTRAIIANMIEGSKKLSRDDSIRP